MFSLFRFESLQKEVNVLLMEVTHADEDGQEARCRPHRWSSPEDTYASLSKDTSESCVLLEWAIADVEP
ncbi:MAG: hypothetical protein AAFS10_25825 [Myxococcota bacterium]